jgi:arylsulfatase A-like enzyme/Flp pilus assembly protein TadD
VRRPAVGAKVSSGTVLAACIILWLGLLAAGCSQGEPVPGAGVPFASGAARGSNVLVVTIDTLRRDRLGAYGHVAGLTPTLDRLSASGVRFARAFSHVPLTLPAHASILTGRTPLQHGLHLNGAARLAGTVPTLATGLKAQGYRTGAFVGAFVLDARYGLNQGFDEYDDHYPEEHDGRSFGFAERRGAEVVEAAGTWILNPTAPGPWLAWVHLFDPHAPYDAPSEFRQGRSPYDAEVAYADAMVGRLIDRLTASHALDHTVIVVTADHGESLGEHGETTHGLFAYDATLAVPLMVTGAGLAPGVIEAPVGHADILPTVLDLLGIGAPPGVDGRSAVQALEADRPIYFEALDAHLTRDWAPLTGVATGQWKYIHLPIPELYDRTTDLREERNLADREPARRDSFERMRLRVASAPRTSAPAAAGDAAADRRLRSLGYATVSNPPTVGTDARVYGVADDPKRLAALNERFNTALEASGAGRSAEALAALLALLADQPTFTTARTSAATVLATTGRPREAAALLRQAPQTGNGSAEIQAKLGAVLREAGDFAGAARALERARGAGYGNPELLNNLGVAYAQLGRVDDARAAFRTLVEQDATSASAWNNLGVLELGAERADAAAEAFRHAVAGDPSRGDAWQGLGAALIARDPIAGIDAWRRAERLLPRDYDLLFNLGIALASGPRPAEAQPYLTRFVREAPRDRYGRDVAQVERLLETLR